MVCHHGRPGTVGNMKESKKKRENTVRQGRGMYLCNEMNEVGNKISLGALGSLRLAMVADLFVSGFINIMRKCLISVS